MFYDFSEIKETDLISDADICIVGAGAAGMAMALQYIDTSYKVLLLEGGKVGFDAVSQKLYHGETTINNEPEEPYQRITRLRMSGGSTQHWSGFCRPFDDHDFEVRDWVANSGWPISSSDLTPYYEKAAAILRIKPFNMDDDRTAVENRFLDNENFKLKNYHYSTPARFHSLYKKKLATAPNIHYIIDANVVNINLNENSQHVDSVSVSSQHQPAIETEVKASRFILATGGIENAKVLLNSSNTNSKGVGNQHDLVGKYFMEHPEYNKPWNMTLTLAGYNVRSFLRTSLRTTAALMPSAKVQQKHKMLNASIMIQPYKDRDVNKRFKGISKAANYIDSLKAPELENKDYQAFSAYLRTEMPPIKDNHCYLTDEKDIFGNQKIALKFGLNELSDHTLSELANALGSELGRSGIGRVYNYYTSGEHISEMMYASHHMGTTRMADNPNEGVVDSNCKVFGVDNLYVAGSSVFCTGSYANPTFTIVALALRLVEHLKANKTV